MFGLLDFYTIADSNMSSLIQLWTYQLEQRKGGSGQSSVPFRAWLTAENAGWWFHFCSKNSGWSQMIPQHFHPIPAVQVHHSPWNVQVANVSVRIGTSHGQPAIGGFGNYDPLVFVSMLNIDVSCLPWCCWWCWCFCWWRWRQTPLIQPMAAPAAQALNTAKKGTPNHEKLQHITSCFI